MGRGATTSVSAGPTLCRPGRQAGSSVGRASTPPVPHTQKKRGGMDQPHYRIDRFDPLLRDLLWWGLVRREEPSEGAEGRGAPDDGQWVLSQEAAQRLTELAARVARPQTGQVLYLDRKCADCHQRVPTRLVEDLFLCDTCRQGR